MNKEELIRFAGLMEDYLNIPSFVCEMIEQQLEENKYKEVVEYVVQRRNEIESKPDFISDRNAITMLVNQNEQKDKEIERLNNLINELEKWLEQEYAIVKANSIEEPNNPEWYIKCNERKNILDKLNELCNK